MRIIAIIVSITTVIILKIKNLITLTSKRMMGIASLITIVMKATIVMKITTAMKVITKTATTKNLSIKKLITTTPTNLITKLLLITLPTIQSKCA